MSRELILKMSISVDGFVAGPKGEIDWIFTSTNDAAIQWIVDLLGNASLHAMGHRTYQDMAAYWPTSISPIARPMNEIPKVVFSRSGTVSPPALQKATMALKNATKTEPSGILVADDAVLEGWRHPTVAGMNLIADVQRLKAEDGKPILAHGGASFASSLISANLLDVIYLVVHPIALGRGLPIFAGLENPLSLKLEDVTQFGNGVAAKTYRPLYTARS